MKEEVEKSKKAMTAENRKWLFDIKDTAKEDAVKEGLGAEEVELYSELVQSVATLNFNAAGITPQEWYENYKTQIQTESKGTVGESKVGGEKFDQIIGERGAAALDAAEEATTRLDNLNVAREMEKAGKDARAIRLATGWERGAEGKWRYEIDDVKIEWSINSRTSLKMDLSEFLLDRTSEELLKAYPELAGVRIVVYPSNQTEDGYYDENNNMIFINSASPNPEMTLIHEIQHVIQSKEGFAEGTNLDEPYSELKRERNKELSPVFRKALKETGLIDERGELKEEYTNEIGVRFFIFDSQVSDIVYGYKN
ncbi:MAG: hypothetical protein LBQ37_00765, partial [Elusimicrobiota bacterium]|nr:hypothetical protein [Elusimicrobiota bacterium]